MPKPKRKYWTPAELATVRASSASPAVLAATLGRSLQAVYLAKSKMGLTRRQLPRGPVFIRFLRAKHVAGWSDAEIAKAYGGDRHTVIRYRRKLGLPHNAYSEHRRQCVAEKTKQQLVAAGLPSIGHLRVQAFRKRARAAGWPEDLRPRAVQILNALWDRGPMTRRELVDVCGMPWKGSRKSLHSNDAEGSYLAHLMRRGLVVCMGRVNRERGKGKSTCVYSLPLWIERNQPTESITA